MFDPLSAEFTADPYPIYRRLQASEAPQYFEPMGCFLLSRYADVEAVARSPVMVRSAESFLNEAERREQQVAANFHDMPNHEQFVQFSMLETDGEVHRRLRMIVLREFSKTFVEKHRQMIQSYVDQLLERLLEMREFDFVEDLAAQVPGHIIGNILGVPDADCPKLRTWSEEVVQYFDADRNPANKRKAEDATTAFANYLRSQIALREDAPRDDLLTTLVSARDRGEMSDQELISTSLLILAGGHGSTIDVLGTGMFALTNHPAAIQLLKNDPGLTNGAVQEMFRYESPLPFFHRYAADTVEVMDKTYPRGTKFGLLYGAANRDPDQFPGPDSFIPDRVPNRHVAFGRGAHLCLGNNLARLDMEIIFSTLLKKTTNIEVTAPPQYRPGLSSRGLKALQVRLTPA